MSDQLIDDYLRELKVAAWIRQLPKPLTASIENETRERIAADLAAAGNSDDATVYSVLDRLGPADDIVAQRSGTSSAGTPGALRMALAPLVRLRVNLAIRGWGAAEIGGLLLLIVGPFLLWWVGPIFGIILIRSAADRWSERAEHVATVVVFSLLAVQALLSVALLVYALASGGAIADQLQRIMSIVGPGAMLPGLTGPIGLPADSPLYLLRIGGGLLAPAAGIVSGIYLALSPRVRR